MEDDRADDWYQEESWLDDDGNFDWVAVLDAIEASERDADFWDWFREQYG